MQKSGFNIALFLIILSSSIVSFAQDSCSEINQAKTRTYGFHPPQLSKHERTEKSKQMDQFWNLVRSKGPQGLSCLKQLMADETNDKYFLFDGASLLANFDRSGASDPAILHGITRTDLTDVALDGYIGLCLDLSHRNVDIGPAADRYLQARNVTVYLPLHGAYELNRGRGAILLYGSLSPKSVDKYLVPALASPDQEVRNTAAMVLAQNMTEDSFRALAALGPMENFSTEAREWVKAIMTRRKVEVIRPAKYTRQQMLEKLARLPDMDSDIDETENKALDNSVYATFTSNDLNALREGRRKMIGGVSNESVEGYEEMSRILLNLINVLDSYSQYRTH